MAMTMINTITFRGNSRDLRLLRYVIRVMRRHYLANKKTTTKTNTKTMTMTNTFREHLEREIQVTYDL